MIKKIFVLCLAVMLSFVLVVNETTVSYASADENAVATDILSRLGIDAEKENNDKSNSENALGEDTTGAYEVYSAFIEKSSFIMNDDSWDLCLEMNDKIGRNTYLEGYLANVDGATEEQWQNMSAYEIFIYSNTYIHFTALVGSPLADSSINNGDKGVDRMFNTLTGAWIGTNAEEVKEAYRALLDWQVEFFRTYNYPYNFVTGKSYAEETGVEIPVSGTEENTNDFTDEELEEIAELIDQSQDEEVLETVNKEDNSNGDDVFDWLKGNWFTLIILTAFLIGLLVVWSILKKRSVAKTTSDDK